MTSNDEFLLKLAGEAYCLANCVEVAWPMMTPDAREWLRPIAKRVGVLCEKVPDVLTGMRAAKILAELEEQP